jgi:hypothetical protein
MANSAPSGTTAVGQERAVDIGATTSQAFVAGSYRARELRSPITCNSAAHHIELAISLSCSLSHSLAISHLS